MRVTNEGQEMSDPEKEKFEKEYMNLGPQWQVPNPEAGPLEQRVQTTFVDGLLSGKIVEKDSEYWFTEPPGGFLRPKLASPRCNLFIVPLLIAWGCCEQVAGTRKTRSSGKA